MALQNSPKIAGVFSIPFLPQPILGVSSERQFVHKDRVQFFDSLSIDSNFVKRVNQKHTSHVVLVNDVHQRTEVEVADGLLTALPDVALSILTADCLPIFMWDKDDCAVGLIHAGWRGLYGRILPSAVDLYQQSFEVPVEKICIAIGPSIRDCCYSVGPEFSETFPNHYFEDEDGVPHVDLIAVARDQLKGSGLLNENILDVEVCTSCQNNRFYSVRREPGTSERIVSIIKRSAIESGTLGRK